MSRVWKITFDQSFKKIGVKRFTETISCRGDLLTAMQAMKDRLLKQTHGDEGSSRDCTGVSFVAAEWVCDLDH